MAYTPYGFMAYTPILLHGLHALWLHGLHAAIYTWLTRHYSLGRLDIGGTVVFTKTPLFHRYLILFSKTSTTDSSLSTLPT